MSRLLPGLRSIGRSKLVTALYLVRAVRQITGCSVGSGLQSDRLLSEAPLNVLNEYPENVHNPTSNGPGILNLKADVSLGGKFQGGIFYKGGTEEEIMYSP